MLHGSHASGKKKKSKLAKQQKEHAKKLVAINEKKREEMKIQLANKEFSEEKEETFRKLTEKYQSEVEFSHFSELPSTGRRLINMDKFHIPNLSHIPNQVLLLYGF